MTEDVLENHGAPLDDRERQEPGEGMFQGVRTFTLAPNAQGETEFSMAERFSGVMLPLIKGSLPDFGPIFEAYAQDLKRAAEAT